MRIIAITWTIVSSSKRILYKRETTIIKALVIRFGVALKATVKKGYILIYYFY